MDAHEEALKKIIGDMDEMEGKKMFAQPKGVDIDISIMPNMGDGESEDKPEEMNKGGMVEAPVESTTDEAGMPPFLRKKKGK